MPLLDQAQREDKQSLYLLLTQELEHRLADTLASANAAHEGATHQDAVAKSKYDTHGLELSYLAGSQFERAKALQTDLSALKASKVRYFAVDEPIEPGAVVELKDTKSGVTQLFLLLRFGAGIHLHWLGHRLTVISPDSPLGLELMGAYQDDEVEVPTSSHPFVILAVR